MDLHLWTTHNRELQELELLPHYRLGEEVGYHQLSSDEHKFDFSALNVLIYGEEFSIDKFRTTTEVDGFVLGHFDC